MTEPGWYCEHCDKPATGISDEADATEAQRCPACHKPTVVWLTPEVITQRNASMNVACPTRTEKAEQHIRAVVPHRQRQVNAAAWFNHMRAVVEQAP